MSDKPAEFELWVDLSELSPLLRPFAEELLERLGPPAETFEDPLAALAASNADPADRPSDPILARLLPDGVMADDAAAVEFRRFTHDTLRARKRRDASFLLAALDETGTSLGREQALQLMGAFNDLRLMLGTALEVTEGSEYQGEGESDRRAYATYELLGWLLEDLVGALTTTGGGEAADPSNP